MMKPLAVIGFSIFFERSIVDNVILYMSDQNLIPYIKGLLEQGNQ